MPVKIVDNTIHAAKVILYREEGEQSFLVTKEADTGLFGFPGGAQDESDATLRDTIVREIYEEIGLSDNAYELIETTVTHEFVHTDQNSPRFGKKGILHLFIAQYNASQPIQAAEELTEVYWLDKINVLKKLEHSYPYWPRVFTETISHI